MYLNWNGKPLPITTVKGVKENVKIPIYKSQKGFNELVQIAQFRIVAVRY